MIRLDRDFQTGVDNGPAGRAPRRVSWRIVFAWLAHLYTALGLILAVVMTVCIMRGGSEGFRWAFFAMLVACLVDATDGTLARRLRVKEVLPAFDGAKLDDLIDFLTFVSLPLLLMWRAELVSGAGQWVLVVALLASGYGFCQVPAKTTDGYFVGFPSYWNIVAFYLYALRFPQWLAAAIVLALAVLVAVPSYYMYPSRGATLSRLTNFFGGVWVVLLVWVLWELPVDTPASASPAAGSYALVLISLFYPVYYMAVSWAITLHRWRRARKTLN
jgi:phosphatidylcholine synthase